MTSAATQKKTSTGRATVWRQLLRHRSGAPGLVLSVFFVLMAVVGPWLAPYDAAEPDYAHVTAPISITHPLGTDNFGRDLLSRVLVGARYSLGIAISATLLGALIGGLWGLWAGYVGGAGETISMRLVDILLAFPGILLAIGLIAITGPGIIPVILATALFCVPIFARLLRGSALAMKERAFVEAAQSLGASSNRIMFRHVLPSIIAPAIVYVTLRTGVSLLVASGLSFLGLGVQPPTPEWGAMLSSAQLYLSIYPLMAFVPGIAITLAVLGFNLLGDGLRDVLDPTIRK